MNLYNLSLFLQGTWICRHLGFSSELIPTSEWEDDGISSCAAILPIAVCHQGGCAGHEINHGATEKFSQRRECFECYVYTKEIPDLVGQ